MIGKVFWFAVGAGSAVYAAVKLRDLASQATPKAIGQRVGNSVVDVSDSFRDFTTRFRGAMAEREAELRDAISSGGTSPRPLGRPD